jgi:acyl-coenzyme A thioesterase PaaI-like protein
MILALFWCASSRKSRRISSSRRSDVSLYAAILGSVGPVALAATTTLNINFLREPAPADLIGEARLTRLGKRLPVGEVAITVVGGEDVVAHAVGTYAIPPSVNA